MSSIKTTIFYIMKTLHNLNNDMHAYDGPFIPCETFLPFHSLRLTFHFILMLMLMLMLYTLQFKLYTLILCKSCLLQIR